MIEQYNVVGLQTTVFNGFEKNKKHLSGAIDVAIALASVELPVKLVVLAETAMQGIDINNIPITEIPGPETEFVSRKAKEHQAYIVGDLIRVRIPGLPPDCLFNVIFLVDPKGEVICQRAKSQVEALEAQCTTVPHDIWDLWVEKFGDGLDAVFPVARTEIGNIGLAVCMERGYPEVFRGLAINGAEVIACPTYHEPFTSNGMFEVQARARALDNTCYFISVMNGPAEWPGMEIPFDICGGVSLITDYRGNVISRHESTHDSFVCATIDIESLRQYRDRSLGIGNFIKDLRTEQFRAIYEKTIYPPNLRLGKELPGPEVLRREEDRILQDNIRRLHERGTYIPAFSTRTAKGKSD